MSDSKGTSNPLTANRGIVHTGTRPWSPVVGGAASGTYAQETDLRADRDYRADPTYVDNITKMSYNVVTRELQVLHVDGTWIALPSDEVSKNASSSRHAAPLSAGTVQQAEELARRYGIVLPTSENPPVTVRISPRWQRIHGHIHPNVYDDHLTPNIMAAWREVESRIVPTSGNVLVAMAEVAVAARGAGAGALSTIDRPGEFAQVPNARSGAIYRSQQRGKSLGAIPRGRRSVPSGGPRQASKRVPLFSLGARRRNKAQWFLQNVDPADVEKSTRGFQVYEYYTAEGECLYVGKSGGLDGKDPRNWVDRGWDHLYKNPQISQADKVKVTADLTHAEAAALEADRIAQFPPPRLNKVEGVPPRAQSFPSNLKSAAQRPSYTFKTTMVPAPGGLTRE